ncbi:hypothetical protein QOZ80_2BG0163160 [Eleusine coracana subsp. coracana]|nr:hypothetical protein QOZ80_2BG0163160 [Eleusine coracana subsp. coracana]
MGTQHKPSAILFIHRHRSLGFRRVALLCFSSRKLEIESKEDTMAIRYADLPPGVKFVPTDKQIIELYLLPRVRGQPDLIPDLFVDDDTAANTQPWKLFSRHGLERQPDDVPAFFFVHTKDARPGARPERGCHGGGSWKSMKSGEQVLKLVDGEKIKWTRHNLNFQMGKGSIGWVMHEYTITDHSSLRICGISFSGHCKKRMRALPDDCLAAGEPVTRRLRVADDSASGSTTSTAFVQDLDMTQASKDQEPGMPLLSDEEITAMVEEMSNAPFQQEQLQTMVHPSSTVQEPAASQEPTMMEQWVVDQEPSAAHQTSEDEEIAAMIAEMTDPQPQPLMAPVMEEQVHQEEEPDNMFHARSYMDLLMTPSSCSVPHMDSMVTGTHCGVVSFEGFEIELC